MRGLLLTSYPEAFRLYYNDSNCKQILLAACYSRYYLTLVQPLVEVHGDRIILVKGDDFEDAFGTLYMRVVEMPSLFPITQSTDSSEDEEDAVAHTKGVGGLRADGTASSSYKTMMKRSPAQSRGSSSSRGRGKKDPEPARARRRRGKPTVASASMSRETQLTRDTAKPKETPRSVETPKPKVSPKYIALNKEKHRIDVDLVPRPSQVVFDAYKRLSVPPCRNHHLLGYCQFITQRCKYDHGPVDEQTLNTLHWFVQVTPCNVGAGCRSSSCLHGHHCSKPGCQQGAFGTCPFPADMHNIDTRLHEKVRPEDDPDAAWQPSGSSRSPSQASQVTSPQRDGSWEASISSGRAGSAEDDGISPPSPDSGDAEDDELRSQDGTEDWEKDAKLYLSAPSFEQDTATVRAFNRNNSRFGDEDAGETPASSSQTPNEPKVPVGEDRGPIMPNSRQLETGDDEEDTAEDDSDLMTFDDLGKEAGDTTYSEAPATSPKTFKWNPNAAAFR